MSNLQKEQSKLIFRLLFLYFLILAKSIYFQKNEGFALKLPAGDNSPAPLLITRR